MVRRFANPGVGRTTFGKISGARARSRAGTHRDARSVRGEARRVGLRRHRGHRRGRLREENVARAGMPRGLWITKKRPARSRRSSQKFPARSRRKSFRGASRTLVPKRLCREDDRPRKNKSTVTNVTYEISANDTHRATTAPPNAVPRIFAAIGTASGRARADTTFRTALVFRKRNAFSLLGRPDRHLRARVSPAATRWAAAGGNTRALSRPTPRRRRRWRNTRPRWSGPFSRPSCGCSPSETATTRPRRRRLFHASTACIPRPARPALPPSPLPRMGA